MADITTTDRDLQQLVEASMQDAIAQAMDSPEIKAMDDQIRKLGEAVSAHAAAQWTARATTTIQTPRMRFNAGHNLMPLLPSLVEYLAKYFLSPNCADVPLGEPEVVIGMEAGEGWVFAQIKAAKR